MQWLLEINGVQTNLVVFQEFGSRFTCSGVVMADTIGSRSFNARAGEVLEKAEAVD